MMTVDDLLRFLIEHQGEKNATKEDAQAIFDSLKHLNIFQRRELHLEAFFRYLLGDHNLAHPPSQKVIGVFLFNMNRGINKTYVVKVFN